MKKIIAIVSTAILFMSSYSYAEHENYYAQQADKQNAKSTIDMTPTKFSGFYTEENFYTKQEAKQKPIATIDTSASNQLKFKAFSLNIDPRITNN